LGPKASLALTSYRNLSALVTCHTLYVVFLDLAECCVFVKQSVDPFHCAQSCDRDPFFRSYGARLPSSLTRFHSRAWVYSTHPPVSVYGTGDLGKGQRLFSVFALKDPSWP